MDSFTGLPVSVCLLRRLVPFATIGTSLFPTQALQIFSLGSGWYKSTLSSLMINGRPLDPFELGAEVRQGNPLSPALFVLIIEPFLIFLRTKMQGLGLQCGSSSHSVIIFADVCTGLLHDLRHTKEFLGYVDEYCLATGMRLNKVKTVVLPFRPWSTSSEPLRLELQHLGVEIVGNSRRFKLLRIYYGPQLSNTDRLTR